MVLGDLAKRISDTMAAYYSVLGISFLLYYEELCVWKGQTSVVTWNTFLQRTREREKVSWGGELIIWFWRCNKNGSCYQRHLRERPPECVALCFVPKHRQHLIKTHITICKIHACGWNSPAAELRPTSMNFNYVCHFRLISKSNKQSDESSDRNWFNESYLSEYLLNHIRPS